MARARGVPASVREVVRAPGRLLDAPTRAFLEPRFGHDFSRVRVHTDPRAQASARALHAHAYAVGEDVVFGAGAYEPGTTAGLGRIAHELAHVVQQSQTPAAPSRLLTARGDESERAASRAADRVATGASAGHGLGTASALIARDAIEGEAAGAPATNVLQEFDVDGGKGHRSWDLDRLVKQIIQAFGSSADRYVQVVGYYDVSEENEAGTARDAALKRVDTVRRALLEWAPKLKGRLRVETRDRDLWREAGGEPTPHQMAVEWGPFGTTAPTAGLNPPPILPSADALAPKAPALPDPLPSSDGAAPASTTEAPTADAKAYPGKALDAVRAFLATPLGEAFKAAGKRELKRAWNDTTLAEKITLLISQLLPLGIGTYGLAALPATEQQKLVSLITSDADTNVLRPLDKKTTLTAGLDLDAGMRPTKVRTSLFDVDLPASGTPAGRSALGVDLRIDKAATKTFFKPEETLSVLYAVPDQGWRIEVVGADGTVVSGTSADPKPNGRLTLAAPRAPGIYTLRLSDRDGSEKRSTRFLVQ